MAKKQDPIRSPAKALKTLEGFHREAAQLNLMVQIALRKGLIDEIIAPEIKEASAKLADYFEAD